LTVLQIIFPWRFRHELKSATEWSAFPFPAVRSSKLDSNLHGDPVSTLSPNADQGAPLKPEDGESRSAVVERLFREHNEALLRFLRGRVGSHNEAREIAQEAYVRLLSLDQPGAVSYLRAFLFKTAANIAIDRRRRNHTFDKVAGGQLFTELAENRTPERQLSGEQTLRHLGMLIEGMPPKCRQAFVMNQIQGLDAATIATQLGVSDSMVRKYVVRALLHCRQYIDLERND
jgi:RNA polymerase sigma factor (sigma-70 family)